MIKTNQKTIEHLEWLLNKNPEHPFYKIGKYDDERYIIKQIRPSTIFESDLIEKLNHAGFGFYSITAHDDVIHLTIKDRRKQ